jgi:succinate-semialdehyde dehydrogenase
MGRARAAQEVFELKSQKETDEAVRAVARTVYDNAEELAEMAVAETGMGNVPDKILKNRQKARIIWNSLKGKRSKGIIERDEGAGVTKIAKPMGVVAAITPMTNPIVTPMSNAMFALKGGNAIIITPHHRATGCSGETVARIRKALVALGLPTDLVQILDEHSRENTRNLISSADVVVATGGSGMVRAAYSSGRPALGVGAGNVQCIIDRGADISVAVPKIVTGRAFDNGILWSAEQSVICPDDAFEAILREFERNGGYVVRDAARKEALRNAIFADGAMNRGAIGRPAEAVARAARIDVPADTKVLVVLADGPGEADVLAKEKMCPVIAAYRYSTFDEATGIAKANLESEGKGHSVCIHSDSAENIERAALALSASRFVVNQVCATSAGGSFFNGLAPTNTLGCGSWGHNSISENLDYKHLINVSRIAYNMEGNPVPSDEELWSL